MDCGVETHWLLSNLSDVAEIDAIIIATAHRQYKEVLPAEYKAKLTAKGVVFDVKGIVDRAGANAIGLDLWRL